MLDFVALLKELLVSEMGYTQDDADALCSKHNAVVVTGIMQADNETQLARNIRPTAMALEIAEADEAKPPAG